MSGVLYSDRQWLLLAIADRMLGFARRREGDEWILQVAPHTFTVLLERPGPMVSREELRNRVWPEGRVR